ncbi:MAG: UpxY family transcription antiterminator [Calditrichaceae bacterium]|nr:UpxY family transcription antiterminator [Calditrichaceae bacterium]MBN2707464.1 UpxY family transcription antiterminator [Calditrichaceae bacterium]RQV94031.1 MAG: UpxY family transcription antiterminator [Calditrichota bacterium]
MIKWYAVYTKPRHEKKAEELLKNKGIETFLPLVKRVRQWKDRKKKVELPLFNGYLFVHIDYKYRFDILGTHGIVKIINFKGIPAVVPDWQIQSLKQMLEHPELVQLEEYMKLGELVRVSDGPFKDLIGTVKQIRGEDRLIITIEGIMQTVSVEVDRSNLIKIKKD